ncbi:hemerythrin family protein [Clostridium tagluense]|uniref:Bacteriohemerythrin n=1 Tax=Clostridium tagluense TaxID=360422 RepID=A0A401UR18_9CLOT|nr:hemerythrin family protein [Clostridium tagluense]MCB2300998.1 hemerythrin family protein [Clostridium tagluense]MCB2313843.1 hemerythrin family protein [Clostridium tagluense]MCB2318676.1 hemerythrin family protein [Clostridium tagluense]MCB2323535.1 hemerythrin family protein [Clostridium tagluense]MCB2328404.1 hemerythrin family protein [Clostridium tagluense]
MFEMKEKYKTGILLIDTEHEKLFEIGERAYQLLKSPYDMDKYDKIVAVIEELRAYTVYHFEDEEKYMESINYKRLFTQKMDHAGFIKKIDEVDLRKIDANQDEAIMTILTYLNDWLVNHILEKDLLIPVK